MVLTLVGGLIGFAVSYLVLRAINASGLIPSAHLGLNYRVFLYGLALAVFFGLFSGVFPAWRMARLHPVEALKGASWRCWPTTPTTGAARSVSRSMTSGW